MKIKQTFLTAVLTASVMLGAAPSFAIGGDDPIPGIDIVIKEDSESKPIKPFSLSGDEMKQINALDNKERVAMTLKVIAKHIDAGEGFVEAGMKAYSEQGCPPQPWTYCGDPEVFSVGKVTYTIDLNFKGDDVARPTKTVKPKVIKGSPKLQELPKE